MSQASLVQTPTAFRSDSISRQPSTEKRMPPLLSEGSCETRPKLKSAAKSTRRKYRAAITTRVNL